MDSGWNLKVNENLLNTNVVDKQESSGTRSEGDVGENVEGSHGILNNSDNLMS